MKTPLVLRYVIWSMLIFAISMGLLSLRGLRSLKLRAIDVSFSGPFYLDPDTKPANEVDVPVMVIPFYEQVSQQIFLESAKEITHPLKEAGAKVVIVPLLDSLRASPRIVASIRALIRDSIVIFGVPGGTNTYYFGSDPALDDKRYWWARYPLLHGVEIPWGVMTENAKTFSHLTRFVPTGFRDYDKGDPVPNVIVLALKRFFDIPDNAELPASPSQLQIGPSAFPIERDGLTYVRMRATDKHVVEMYASLNEGSDSLTYFPAIANRVTDTAAIHAAWQAHKGKIVILDWNGTGSYRDPTRGSVYANVVSSFFNRSFVKVHNEWNVLLVTTLVIFLSVVSYALRNGLMIFLSLILSVTAVFISVRLFNSHDVLFEPIYVIVPIILCGFVLPIAKLAGEKRIAEERVKSLMVILKMRTGA